MVHIRLILPSDSLFSQNQSLISLKTFPDPFSREFVKKGQRRRELFSWMSGKNGEESSNSLYFPCLSGNLMPRAVRIWLRHPPTSLACSPTDRRWRQIRAWCGVCPLARIVERESRRV